MASIIQLKRRIKTAQNISKSTRAMNMIATSKLKRAQDAALSSRPYVERLQAIVQAIATNVDKGDQPAYMIDNKAKNDLYVVISPDKGLCGGMIANLAREYLKQVQNKDTIIITIGKKIESHVVRSKKEIAGSFIFGHTLPSFNAVYSIAKLIDELYLEAKVRNVYIITTKFKSVFSQEPTTIKLLPAIVEIERNNKLNPIQLFEPSAKEILPGLLRKYLETTLYQNMVENYTSYQAAQMTAMKNATDNAKEMIEDLKLVYNKTRQERITSELLDIAGSAFSN